LTTRLRLLMSAGSFPFQLQGFNKLRAGQTSRAGWRSGPPAPGRRRFEAASDQAAHGGRGLRAWSCAVCKRNNKQDTSAQAATSLGSIDYAVVCGRHSGSSAKPMMILAIDRVARNRAARRPDHSTTRSCATTPKRFHRCWPTTATLSSFWDEMPTKLSNRKTVLVRLPCAPFCMTRTASDR
jgi:hypothetical protein